MKSLVVEFNYVVASVRIDKSYGPQFVGETKVNVTHPNDLENFRILGYSSDRVCDMAREDARQEYLREFPGESGLELHVYLFEIEQDKNEGDKIIEGEIPF